MNPIRTIARFNNHLAWWWGGLISETMGVERQWALSSGSRIASLMIGFNSISAVLLFEKFTGIKLSLIASMVITAVVVGLLYLYTNKNELHDFGSIQSFTPERIHGIRQDSILYLAVTLISLMVMVFI